MAIAEGNSNSNRSTACDVVDFVRRAADEGAINANARVIYHTWQKKVEIVVKGGEVSEVQVRKK